MLQEWSRLLIDSHLNHSHLVQSIIEKYSRLSPKDKFREIENVVKAFGPKTKHLETNVSVDGMGMEDEVDSESPGVDFSMDSTAPICFVHHRTSVDLRKLFREISVEANGIKFLVDLRGDCLKVSKKNVSLKYLVDELRSSFTYWFAPGCLELRQVNSPHPTTMASSIVDDPRKYIIDWCYKHERVMPVKSIEEYYLRFDEQSCIYSYFHPSMVNPLIFVHVAFMTQIPSSMADILSRRHSHPSEENTVACFYSFNTCPGLRGLDLGTHLITSGIRHILETNRNITRFCTISPIPLFTRFLSKQDEEIQISFQNGSNKTKHDIVLNYLLYEKHCIVKDFNCRNGAKVGSVLINADTSDVRLKQSFGIMVNYIYEPNDLHENYMHYISTGIPLVYDSSANPNQIIHQAIAITAKGSQVAYMNKLNRMTDTELIAEVENKLKYDTTRSSSVSNRAVPVFRDRSSKKKKKATTPKKKKKSTMSIRDIWITNYEKSLTEKNKSKQYYQRKLNSNHTTSTIPKLPSENTTAAAAEDETSIVGERFFIRNRNVSRTNVFEAATNSGKTYSETPKTNEGTTNKTPTPKTSKEEWKLPKNRSASGSLSSSGYHTATSSGSTVGRHRSRNTPTFIDTRTLRKSPSFSGENKFYHADKEYDQKEQEIVTPRVPIIYNNTNVNHNSTNINITLTNTKQKTNQKSKQNPEIQIEGLQSESKLEVVQTESLSKEQTESLSKEISKLFMKSISQKKNSRRKKTKKNKKKSGKGKFKVWETELKKMGLSSLKEKMTKEGVDDVNVWPYLTNNDLEKIGFRRVHIRRWRKHFSEPAGELSDILTTIVE